MTPAKATIDELLSDEGLRALANLLFSRVVDAVAEKRGEHPFLAETRAPVVDSYYQLLSNAHQKMIAEGLTPKERHATLLRLGRQIVAQQIPVAEKLFVVREDTKRQSGRGAL